MRKTIFVLALICCFPLFSNAQLTHVQGVNAIGIRGGTGVKGTMNFGLTYNYYVARTLSISAELDYERGKIDNSLFQGYLLSPGVEWSVWNPAKWFYLNLTGGLSAGYDIWKDPTVDAKFQGFTFGGNLGLSTEFFAGDKISFVLKAQQYYLYNTTAKGYWKPLFTAGIRFNF